MNGITVTDAGQGSTAYLVQGVESAAAVNQAKKHHANTVGCDFYDLNARTFGERDDGTLVVVVGPKRNPHRLAAAEPRQQPEADD